ncbi:hypothetical protein [Ascidiimonas aurantiaca]|uniref:hypothetical protein n=1 Tax=Ascidiimonas aurantiaca TaxID=1685432 RepID=UPI0030ED1ED4
MKRKSLQYLKFTKISISNLQKIGGRPPDGGASGHNPPDDEGYGVSVNRICTDDIMLTLLCHSNFC